MKTKERNIVWIVVRVKEEATEYYLAIMSDR